MTNEVQTYNQQSVEIALRTPQQVIQQLKAVQDLMSAAMIDKQDYGTIPGCGDKPTLLKPGAEKLCAMFRLGMKVVKEDVKDLPGGHREYETTAEVFHQPTGATVCHGVGVATTMESKHRFRTGAGEVTNIEVPKQYWDHRRENPAAAAKALADFANAAGYEGTKFGTKKDDAGVWRITTHGEKVENDNPADCYNTVRKMAKKRAFVDAVITATNASCIFTQDIEDMQPEHRQEEQPPRPADNRPASTNASGNPNNHQQFVDPVDGVATGKLQPVITSTGTSGRGPWTKFDIIVELPDGACCKFTTFDKGFGDYASGVVGSIVRVTGKPGKRQGTWDAVNIDMIDQQQGAVEADPEDTFL